MQVNHHIAFEWRLLAYNNIKHNVRHIYYKPALTWGEKKKLQTDSSSNQGKILNSNEVMTVDYNNLPIDTFRLFPALILQ